MRWNLERLGEPGTLSLAATLLYFPFGLAGPLLIDPARLGGSLWSWVIIAFIAQLALMVAYVIARRIIHPTGPTRSRPMATVIAILLAVELRGLVLVLASELMGLSDQPEWAYRLVSGPIAQGVALILLGLVVSTYRHHQRLAADLESTREATIALNTSMRERLDAVEADLAAQVHRTIDPLLRELDEVLLREAARGDTASVQKAIRSLIDDQLRPLSTRLARGSDELPSARTIPVGIARIPLPERMAMRTLLRPRLVALLAGLAASSQALRGLEPPVTVIFPIATMAVAYVLLAGVRAILGRWKPALIIGILASAGIAAAGFAITLSVLIALGLPLPEDLLRASLAVGGVWGALTATYQAVNERRSTTEEQLRISIDELRQATSVLRRRTYIASRHLSYVVHGALQSALHSAALRLAANPHPSTELIESIREGIGEAVSKVDAGGAPYAQLVATLDDIVELWEGTATIHWTMDHRTIRVLVESPDAAICAAEIARECVTNAIRHGRATEIRLSLAGSGERVVITTVDNGIGISTDSLIGLGTRMLDELCLAWRREATGSGTKVIAEISVGVGSAVR